MKLDGEAHSAPTILWVLRVMRSIPGNLKSIMSVVSQLDHENEGVCRRTRRLTRFGSIGTSGGGEMTLERAAKGVALLGSVSEGLSFEAMADALR